MNFSTRKVIAASRPNPSKRISGYVVEGYGIMTTSAEFYKVAQLHILRAQESPVERIKLWHLSVAEEALNILEILTGEKQ